MITAKLFIRGIREPLELTEEQGRKADLIKRGEGEYSDIGDKDTISIGDLWTGEKGDMKYIKFETFREPVQETTFSSKEMFDFEKEIFGYFIKEGDAEFNKYVQRFVDDIIDLESKLFWSGTTKNMILAVRNEFDAFPSFETWKKEDKTEKHEKEKEEDFQTRLKNLYDEGHKFSLRSVLEGNRDEKIQEEALRIAKSRIVGTLGNAGEVKYLQDQKVIKVEDDGSYTILKSPDGSIGYGVVYHKLEKYKDWKAKIEYASGKEMEGYAEMANQIGNETQDEE